MLTRVEIKGFKCLHDVSVDLGPFNVLIGPNDSGKSSFLQAIGQWRDQQRLDDLGSADSYIQLSTADQTLLIKSRKRDHIGSVIRSLEVDARPPIRTTEPVALDAKEIASPSPRGSGELGALISSRGRGATAHLARVALGDRERYETIQKGMRDITGGRIREVIVGEDNGQGYPLSFRLHDGKVVGAGEMSQGLLLYFAYLTIVHRDDPPAVLLIEEPENGIHPLRLHEIVTLLRTLTEKGVQILLTTHSPDLLNACRPEEVIVFRRPKPESGTEISRLPADFERRAMRSSLGEIWASSGEEGLLDMLPPIDPKIQAAE